MRGQERNQFLLHVKWKIQHYPEVMILKGMPKIHMKLSISRYVQVIFAFILENANLGWKWRRRIAIYFEYGCYGRWILWWYSWIFVRKRNHWWVCWKLVSRRNWSQIILKRNSYHSFISIGYWSKFLLTSSKPPTLKITITAIFFSVSKTSFSKKYTRKCFRRPEIIRVLTIYNF